MVFCTDVKPAKIMMDEKTKMIVFVDCGLCRQLSMKGNKGT